MDLVAEDIQGLKTYGARLGFASPRTALSTMATAEGNVQVSYFDSQGRMRMTQYDATSDSLNRYYEQWVPSNISACRSFDQSDAMLTLDKERQVKLSGRGYTAEAWFYYPMVRRQDGKRYAVNTLVSSADGKDAAPGGERRSPR